MENLNATKMESKMDWAKAITPLFFSLVEFISFVIILALRGDHDCSNKTAYYGQMIGWCILASLIYYAIIILAGMLKWELHSSIACILGLIQLAIGITLFVVFIIAQVYLYKSDNDCVDGWKAMYIWTLIYVILVYVSFFFVLLICIVLCCCCGAAALAAGADLSRRDYTCLLYTSDAADDTPCVDLGGRRIIKKKKHTIIKTLITSPRKRYKKSAHDTQTKTDAMARQCVRIRQN
eukprot:TRINITY_DN1664_c0_g1_i5.p1 TRINITY_DN1664_c0_g1~~TRINITY_DN1664_c0_g1_i5.p1  ORF type:complete len:236 (-),score=19.21 TRINITY_DN1664_c0_g1_i5:1-708(-)